MTPERWRLVVGHPRYLVSDRGRVRRIGGRVLRPQPQSKGYRQVYLSGDGPGRRGGVKRYVHHLVAEAFIGPRRPGFEVDHLNFDRSDNRLGNLRYLEAAVNAVRWGGRHSDGRIIWLHRREPDLLDNPDDYALTDLEAAAIADDLERQGWTGATA